MTQSGDNPKSRESSAEPEQNQQVTSSISSALLKVRETMTPLTPVDGQDEAKEDRSPMVASASWFRRLWTQDDNAVVSIVPDTPAGSLKFGSASSSPALGERDTHQHLLDDSPREAHVEDGPEISDRKISDGTSIYTASHEGTPDQTCSTASPGTTAPESQDALDPFPGNLQHQDPVVLQEKPATQMATESESQTVSTLPTTDHQRPRPQRPVAFQELLRRLPTLASDLPAAQVASPVLVPVSQSSNQSAEAPAESTTQAVPASISAARRTAGQPAANPFERPSLYRPPTTDESFDAAFTSSPEAASQSPTGRWDPIPTLRPSGWRDSGSYRAARDVSSEEAWNWTTGKNPPSGTGWAEEPVSPPADDSELILTRQWGLLSRFQQSRGLGLANRRTTKPNDDSGIQDASDSLPEPTRRKG